MIKFKEKLLYKYLNEEHLNELERKKFNEYVDKTNIFTYCRCENEKHLLNKNYIKWSEIKIKRLNSELSKDKNIMKFLNETHK